MKTFKEFLNEGEQYTKGLHQAKVGDPMWIGIQGNRSKWRSKVKKILSDGKIVDEDGNIFHKDGQLYRGKTTLFMKKYNNNKTVSAQLVTQHEYDQEYKQIKIDFLRKFDYSKLPVEVIEKMIEVIPNWSQTNSPNKSRFD